MTTRSVNKPTEKPIKHREQLVLKAREGGYAGTNRPERQLSP
jgi:hypothetical protein